MKLISFIYHGLVLCMLGFICYKVLNIDLYIMDTHAGMVTLFQLLFGGK